MSMQKMLEEEITSEFEALKKLNPGEEQHKTAVNSLTQLMDRAIELEKSKSEVCDRIECREIDVEFKRKQLDEDKKDRIVRYIMTGVKDAAIIGVTIWGTVASINFEKEGSITTSAGRKHLNKVLSWFK